MAQVKSSSQASAKGAAGQSLLPQVTLELRHGQAAPAEYEVADTAFLVGSVPGCDLRVPGANLPPVLCVLNRQPGRVELRKLASTQMIQVNGRAVTHCLLNSGDRIRVAGVDLTVAINHLADPSASEGARPTGEAPVVPEGARQQLQQQLQRLRDEVVRFQDQRDLFEAEEKHRLEELRQRCQDLDERDGRVKLQVLELEKDRALWQQQRSELEHELREHRAALDAYHQQREAQRQAELQRQTEETSRQQQALDVRAQELEQQRQEFATVRQELADIRRQLYDRYRERRDRLAGLQDAVNRAARKVQERKQSLDAESAQLDLRRQEEAARDEERDAKTAELDQTRQRLDEERGLFEKLRDELHADVTRRLAECNEREEKLQREHRALEDQQAQHRDDLVRLDRLQGTLREREQQIQQREQDLGRRCEQFQRDTQDLEQQVAQLDDWHTKLTAVGERIAKQKAEADAATSQLAQRSAALEGQQAALAALRTRLERMREEVRVEEQALAEQRARQQQVDQDLNERLREVERLRTEIDQEKILHDQERIQLQERSATMEAAVQQLRQAQDRLAADAVQLRERAQQLDQTAAQQAEEASLTQARAAQLQELQKGLETEREALRERNQLLAQAEQTREALQEQLRRRSEELAGRQKALAEQIAAHQAEIQRLDKQREEIDRHAQQSQEQLAARQQNLQAEAATLETQRGEIEQREKRLEEHNARLQEAGRKVASERKAVADERSQLVMEKVAGAEALAQQRAEFEGLRREAHDLQRRLPELELRAGGALERLTHVREQLRDHLGEVHQYARQCQEDLEGLRGQLQAEAGRLLQQEQALRRGQEEQRLTVAAFRQQLIDWQGQIGEMKRLLAQDETRLLRRRDEVAEQARQIDADTARLAQQTQRLHEQQRVVAERRQEVDRHLGEMREWYRRKMRELAGIDHSDTTSAGREQGPVLEEVTEARRDILSLTGNVDPADRKLGELLRSLELIEADTLTVLLVEARRQRRSLRQVLLASGAVTVYQMALIEAGNLDALMLGPLRVVDRLRATPREVAYRVFDPRRGAEAVLRHLSEAASQEAGHADEFRRLFTQAKLEHPNLAATLEVLDIGGRPAVLQEWLTGLVSTEWPPLSAAPGVWIRLLRQAALGLQAAHQAGLVHGHLHAGLILLTGDGMVKVCGFGEPHWLAGRPVAAPDPTTDLAALGQIAAEWCAASKTTKSRSKTLVEPLQSILTRLQAGAPEQFRTAAALRDALDQNTRAVPSNPEAWDRLLHHAHAHATPQALLRQSA